MLSRYCLAHKSRPKGAVSGEESRKASPEVIEEGLEPPEPLEPKPNRLPKLGNFRLDNHLEREKPP